MVHEGIVLGHKISERGIEVDKAKVDAIEKMPCPKDIKGTRSFLGHAGFYRRFIKDFSKISRPLTNLLQTACHFLLLLLGFDTLTYRKDYNRSPILVGHHWRILLRSSAPGGRTYVPWKLLRKASSKSSQLPIEFSSRLFNQYRAGPLSFSGRYLMA